RRNRRNPGVRWWYRPRLDQRRKDGRNGQRTPAHAEWPAAANCLSRRSQNRRATPGDRAASLCEVDSRPCDSLSPFQISETKLQEEPDMLRTLIMKRVLLLSLFCLALIIAA